MPRSVEFVRTWVRLYTTGLPESLRYTRREEIDADLWEQAQEAAGHEAAGGQLTTQLLLRWFMGLPDDLLWRLLHIRTKDSNNEGDVMVHANDYRTMTVIVGILAAVALGMLLVNTVIGEISFQRQTDFDFYINHTVIMSVYGPTGIAAIVGGFWFMRKAPMLGALLVTAGSLALAIMLFWLIIPELIAVGLSFYAYRRAHRIRSGR